MKALCWYGRHDVRIENVKDPHIINPHDAIIKVTSTAICGSDLHLYDGFIPTLKKGDILGHEFMGEVVEIGPAVKKLKIGDRVVIPFTISCGQCAHCSDQEFSLCDNSNPNAEMNEKIYGHSPAGLFGYSHMMGGYAGGQAEYVRVPFADVGPFKVPASLPDDKVLFMTDIFPTGYMAAENCGIRPGDVVAVWGAGPVGLFAIKSAFMLGAGEVIAIDRFPERLDLARTSGAQTLNYSDVNVLEALNDMTGGRGPDHCIDAVGMEAHGHGASYWYDKVKTNLMMETDRPVVLREAIQACGKGGTVSMPGVYGGLLDKIPMGAAFQKGVSFKMGQTHVQRYLPKLLAHIEKGDIDPSFVITHKVSLSDAPAAYKTFLHKRDNAIKFVLNP